ncbi:MAG: hypothetical protein KF801_10170 [Cryobacterium sp.]|nr:hypothetical protein [Cryobacterium sp.]
MESSAATPTSAGRVALPFLVVGTAAVIFGGLFSAATARSATYHSAWFVAYLVLVVGVAQVALGLGEWWLASRPLRGSFIWGQVVLFALGNTGVMLGSLSGSTLWVDGGSVVLIVAFGSFGWAVRSPRHRGWAFWTFWALIVFLLASVVVGLYFAHVGAP